jgi:HNH endonuclease/NUMOD4 motif
MKNFVDSVENMDSEIWLSVRTGHGAFSKFYEVSNLGRVKSFRYFKSGRKVCLLKPSVHTKGYLYVGLAISEKGIKCKLFKVHRLVAEAFIDRIVGKEHINHKDGDKQNNRVDNLEWCTPKENARHAHATGLIVHRRVSKFDLQGNFMESYRSLKESARENNISRDIALSMVTGHKTHKKYDFTLKYSGA